jgi:hypothetical protein
MTVSEYDRLCREAEDALRPRLTPEFLETLREAIRIYGHTGDMIATVDFGRYCYDVARAVMPGDELWEEKPDSSGAIF